MITKRIAEIILSLVRRSLSRSARVLARGNFVFRCDAGMRVELMFFPGRRLKDGVYVRTVL